MKILYCSKCKEFTLKETCSCGNITKHIKPARYSPEDKYGKYRRIAKQQQQGL